MLTPGRKYVGTTVRISVNFQDDDGTDTDPSGVTFETFSPSGEATLYTYETDADLVKLDTGDYHIDVVPDESGRWTYRWTSTGNGTSVVVGGTFVVMTDPWTDGRAPDAYRS